MQFSTGRPSRAVRALFDSECPACGGDILEGDEIIPGADGFVHAQCPEPELEEIPRLPRCPSCGLEHPGEC